MKFSIEDSFRASPEDVFDAWLDSASHSAMTGGEAEITANIGDSFTAWDGYISGRNLEIERPNRIVQSWRTTQFHENQPDSKVELLFEATESGCLLILNHFELSEDDEHYKQGWVDHYFSPMHSYFG